MHEITPEFYMSKYGIARDSMLIRLITWLERVSFDFADHVLTINQPILDLLVRRGLSPAKATVIMNAVDETPFAESSRRAAAAPAAGDRFVMMYHGTLTSTYGLDLAVEAFAIAHQDMPGAEIWILGSGPESEALAAQAQRCGLAAAVRMVGQVPAKDIPAWLEQCDLGLLPFRVDVFLDLAFPNKLPEFIVMGKPVAIPRLTAIRHYFSDAALAYFAPNDPADLARQMVRLYRDRALGQRLAARATDEYAPIRWDVMKQRYLDLVGAVGAAVRQPVAPAGAPLADKAAGR
jgi:glycosyltransferase involved in cell wall biosynthesis